MQIEPQNNGTKQAAIAAPLRPIDLERGEKLLYRLTEFGRLLWEVGIQVGPRQMIDLAETLNLVDITRPDDFYNTLKCSLLTRHEQEPLFEQMYQYFWFVRDNPNQKNLTRASRSSANSASCACRLLSASAWLST